MKFLITQILLFCTIGLMAQNFEGGMYTLTIESTQGTNKSVQKQIAEFNSINDVEQALLKTQLEKKFVTSTIASLKSVGANKLLFKGKSNGKDVTVTLEMGAHSDKMVYLNKGDGDYEIEIDEDGSGKKKIIRMKKQKDGVFTDDESVFILDGDEDGMTWHQDDDHVMTFTTKPGNLRNRALMLHSDAAAGKDRPYLGIVVEAFDYKKAKNNHPKGVEVTSVVMGEAAYNAGLEEGDVITALGDVKTPSPSLFKKAVKELETGKDIKISYYRNGNAMNEVTTVGVKQGIDFLNGNEFSFPGGPEFGNPAIYEFGNHPSVQLGDKDILNFTGKMGPRLGISGADTENGVEVKNVSPRSTATEMGIEEGDVITKFDGKKVETIEQLAELVQAKEVGEKVAVEFTRNGKKKKESAELQEGNLLQMGNMNFNFFNEGEFPMIIENLNGLEHNFENLLDSEELEKHMEQLKKELQKMEKELDDSKKKKKKKSKS